MRNALYSMMLVLAVSGTVNADEPKPIELTIGGRTIETPLLKYRLFPSDSERKPGNAVPILLRLPWDQTAYMTTVFPTFDDWELRPLNANEWKNAGGVLPDNFYNEMKRAAYRRDATWEYPIGETSSPYMILLPDMQGLRGFLGRGLSARIRYHLSQGDLEKAREGILIGFANGRHIAQTPFYITQLIAASIHVRMLERIDELIAQPKSPNLYWALTTLPDSLVELNRATGLERDIFAMTFPAMNDFERPRSEKEWNKMARQLVDFLEEMDEIPKQEKPKADKSFSEVFWQRLFGAEKSHLAKFIQLARAELPKMIGVTAERVTVMSDDEVSLRWYTQLRVNRDQHAAAVLSLPPREAWPELRKLQLEIHAMHEKTSTKGHDQIDTTAVFVRTYSLKRKIAALRIIEAVRHHIATQPGGLPTTLDEMKDVSIPIDPLTDQPFEWTVNGKSATLKAPSLPSDVVPANSPVAASSALEYRLQVK